jgi:putative membrane-bound dehydrogenase-like protein
VSGKQGAYGIGTHANSVIRWRVPKGYSRFHARAALDQGGYSQGPDGCTVRFAVATKFPSDGLQIGKRIFLDKAPGYVDPSLFKVADGLELRIWARSPAVRNPTNMDVDAAGRVWVTEGMNYRGSRLREKGDRVVVLEDADRDGWMDGAKVFVQDEDLISPLGIAVIGNRVVVSQPPNLIMYTDVNRNLKFEPKVDRRDVLLSGFSGKNHDHSLHATMVGPDGWWYVNCGNMGGRIQGPGQKEIRLGSFYNHPDLAGKASDDGHRYLGGALLRWRPNGGRLSVVGHNFRNSYEQAINSFGEIFQSDNDDVLASRTSYLPEYGNAGYADASGLRKWQADKKPWESPESAHWRQSEPGVMPAGDIYGGGAPTGMAFYENGALGPAYSGTLLACDAARNAVYGYKPERQGAGWKLERTTVLTSNPSESFAGIDFVRGATRTRDLQTFFRPSDVVVGADGYVYLADWFDARVGGHATRDEGASGTIYRLGPKSGRASLPNLNLETTAGQIAALCSPALHVRALGFEALVKGGEASVSALQEVLDHEDRWLRARAVWPLAYCGESGRQALGRVMADSDPEMRLVALRAILRSGMENDPAELALDESPAVRAEVARSLRDVSFDKAKKALLLLAERLDANDRWELEAFGTACSGKEVEAYAYLQPRLGAVIKDWTPAFSAIAWRLHVPVSVPHLRERALASNLPEAARIQALESLVYVGNEASKAAIAEVADAAAGELGERAKWWVSYLAKR